MQISRFSIAFSRCLLEILQFQDWLANLFASYGYDCPVYNNIEKKRSFKKRWGQRQRSYSRPYGLSNGNSDWIWSTVLAPKCGCQKQHVSAHVMEIFEKLPMTSLRPDVKKLSQGKDGDRANVPIQNPAVLYQATMTVVFKKLLCGLRHLFSWNEENCPRTFLKWERRLYNSSSLCTLMQAPQTVVPGTALMKSRTWSPQRG